MNPNGKEKLTSSGFRHHPLCEGRWYGDKRCVCGFRERQRARKAFEQTGGVEVAFRHVWQIMNRRSRGFLSPRQALGAIMHVCMKALSEPKQSEEVNSRC